MRRVWMLGLLGLLGACEGHNTWWNPPFSTGYNPNQPRGDSPNLRRVMGSAVASDPLTPEPGDIWPGPVPEIPTLQEIERDSGLFGRFSSAPPVGSPPVGSPSVGSASGGLPPGGLPPGGLPSGTGPVPSTAPPAPNQAGRIVNAPSGPSVTSGGTSGYQTTTTPRGSAIIVPNGNGTSTVIHPDGRIETIPTPR